MPFTDDNLQQLKRVLNQRVENMAVWAPSLQALIYRLEAAELLAECLSNHEDLDPVEVTEIQHWRKVAGK